MPAVMKRKYIAQFKKNMFRKIFLLALLSGALMILCQCSSKPGREKARIGEMEEEFYGGKMTFDAAKLKKGEALLAAYIDYADKHKDSTDAPHYLFRAGDMALSLNKPEQALGLYNRVIYQYPESQKVPECLFLVGFIHENYLQNYGKAREIYQQFLDKYPAHELADDAAISIQNLGKSPEQLIQEFEARN